MYFICPCAFTLRTIFNTRFQSSFVYFHCEFRSFNIFILLLYLQTMKTRTLSLSLALIRFSTAFLPRSSHKLCVGYAFSVIILSSRNVTAPSVRLLSLKRVRFSAFHSQIKGAIVAADSNPMSSLRMNEYSKQKTWTFMLYHIS